MIKPEELIELFKFALNNEWGYIWGTAGIIWTEAKQKKATREQTVKYGSKWIGHTVADCSGLFSWAFEKLGGTMYHGSNTMYKSWCTRKGKLYSGKNASGEELKPGTAVFIWNADEQKYSHVGLYIGNGEVIEAAGTRQGVIKGKVTNSKWTHWGELKGVDYGAEPSPEPTPEPTPEHPTLRKGDKGEAVRYMQLLLTNHGYSLGQCGIDGSFGLATEKAVRLFQSDHSLTADGICGPATWAALEATPETHYTVTIPNLDQATAEKLVSEYPGAKMEMR